MRKILVGLMMILMVLAGVVQSAFASPVGGNRHGHYRILGQYRQTFTQRFYTSEYAEVEVSGDGDTDLDVYVYNSNGRLIAKDDDDGGDALVRFYVPSNSYTTVPAYKIVVVNRGTVYNDYRIWMR